MRGFAIFLAYVIVEVAVAIWLASIVGWLIVIGLTIAGFFLGLVVIQNAGMQAASSLRAASDQQSPDGAEVGDSGIKFAAGVLIGTPGFVTDVLGLVMLIPPVRSLIRKGAAAWFVRWARGKNMSVVTTNVDGTTVTKVVPGDVIVGDVIAREDESPDSGDRPENGSNDDPGAGRGPGQLPPGGH